MATMRAARLHGNKDVRVEDVPIPKPGPNQCLVEVEWCGICGSDLHEYVAGAYGDLVRWALDSSHRVILPQKYERLLIKTGPLMTPIVDPETGEARPASLGHEFCGRLKSVPTGSQLEVGQAVMVDPHCICHQCACCTSGSDNLCQKLGFLGGTPNLGGGLSEFVAVEERHCHALPDNVDLENAAVIEPMVVCHHAAKAAGVKLEGLDVLILGGGPVGTALISILKAHLVGKIFLSEPTAKRKEQNKDSVDITIDPKTENVGDVCRKLTGGKGVDVVFDCAGVQVGLEAGFDAVKHAGVFVNVAVWEKPIQIPFYVFLLKEINVRSSCAYTEVDFTEVMDLMAKGVLDGYERMITSRISLEDTQSQGFEELVTNTDNQIKILVTPKKRRIA